VEQPKVAVIVLNWNGLDDTVECLESLRKISYPNYAVVVVDNGSEGDDVRVLNEKFGDYIHIVENEKNYGFAEGNNIGIRYSLNAFDPAYLLLLNNDMVVAPEFLGELVRVAESDTGIGILGPRSYRYGPKGIDNNIHSAGGRIRWWHPHLYDMIVEKSGDPSESQVVRAVDWVSGSAMMLRRCVIEKLSLLNPRYFFGDEDVEYCLRAHKSGFRIVHVPAARVGHKIGRSRKKVAISVDYIVKQIVNHYRLIYRNFPLPVFVYHVLLAPVFLAPPMYHYIRKYGNGIRERLSILQH
jgi:GT2 family glycosyltransferase